MKKILIRFMKLTDIKQTKVLNEQTLPENYPLQFWAEVYPTGKAHSVVAVYGGEIIGYVFCNEDSILSFAVNENYRRRGIGKVILSACLSTFSKQKVSLNVRVGNVPALKLYKVLGFVIEKEEIGYYGNGDLSRGPLKPVENAYHMSYTPPNGTIKIQLPQKLKIK